MSNSHHVVSNPNSGWDGKRGETEKSSVHTDTKQEAIDSTRVISRNARTELCIHGKDGKIQSKDSHGNDPRNIRG